MAKLDHIYLTLEVNKGLSLIMLKSLEIGGPDGGTLLSSLTLQCTPHCLLNTEGYVNSLGTRSLNSP